MIKPVCPHCAVSLNRRSNLGVFQYFCPSCFGFSVAFGGLKKILDPVVVSRLWRESETAPESKTRCSHCCQPMREVFHIHGHANKNIELDICRNCILVWLDTGEWGDLEQAEKREALTRSQTEAGYRAEYAKILLAMEHEKIKVKKGLGSEVAPSDLGAFKSTLAFLGLPVEEDADQLRAEPIVTWFLIGVCFLLGLVTLKISHGAFLKPGQDLILKFGYMSGMGFPKNILNGITSFFVHGSWMHLVGNMYFLWIFGDNVEDHLGKIKYVCLILLATFMGHLFYGMYGPRAMLTPSVGASGGISGVLAYYLLRFPRRRFVFRFFYFRLIAVPAYLFGMLYLLKEVFGAFMQAQGHTSVSHLAHLGGAFAGLFFAMLYSPTHDLEKND